jgi:hypothetical protein
LTFTFDPKIVYDHYEDRFVVVALERVDTGSNPDPGNISRILLAVSKTDAPATPTIADWHYHAINSETFFDSLDHWADYPGFEVDEDAVYITANMFEHPGAAGSTFGVRLWIVDKGAGSGGFYDGGPASVTVHDPYAEVALPAFATTTMPAQVFGPGGIVPGSTLGTFLVAYSGLTFGGPGMPEAVQVITVDDPLGSGGGPFFTHEFVTIGDIEDVGGVFGFPPLDDAPQFGTGVLIEVNDRRALDAVWRDDLLWMTTTIEPNSGLDIGQTTAHYIRLNTASGPGSIALDQEGDIGAEDIASVTYTYFPSVAVNSAGDAKFGFSASAQSIFAGAFVAGLKAGEMVLQPSLTVHAGEDFYIRTFNADPPENRWGDYSGISVDPVNDDVFWVFNEYAGERGTPFGGEDGRWETAWASCTFELTPAEPGVCYASTGGGGQNPGSLLRINPFTGAGTLIGPIGPLPQLRVPGLAINSMGEMFGSNGATASELLRIDALNPALSVLVGPIVDVTTGVTLSFVDALVFDENDVLYGSDGVDLYTINTSTAAATLVGNHGLASGFVVGLAFEPATGRLFGSQGGLGGNDEIYEIDKNTGLATVIGQTGLGGATPDLCFLGSILYGNKNPGGGQGGAPADFIRIDPVNGSGTVVGSIGFGSVSGIASFGSPGCTITPGTSFNIFVGEFLTFDVTATGDVLPPGATMTPAILPPLVGPSPLSSTFEWTPAVGQEGIYLFGYLITDSLGNQTFCKVDITVKPDTIPPLCEVTNIDPGPPFTIEVTIQDNESGVAAINVVFSNNAIITIPPFTPGTNNPIIVTAEKIDQTQSATVVLEVVDVAGNTTLCDPVTQRIGAVDVAIKVYDITGREVITLVNKPMEPGRYSVQWDATNNHGETVAGGIYVYRMVAGDFVATRKMLLLK